MLILPDTEFAATQPATYTLDGRTDAQRYARQLARELEQPEPTTWGESISELVTPSGIALCVVVGIVGAMLGA